MDYERRANDGWITAELTELKVLVQAAAEDIRDTKDAATHGLDLLAKRVTYLEEVRVRAIEDQMLRDKVLSNERDEVRRDNAKAQAEAIRIAQQRLVGRREFWLGVAAVVATILTSVLGALITAGHLL